MTEPFDVGWTIGHRRWGASSLHEHRDRGERIHLKTIGKFSWTPETTVDDINETVAGWWLLGKLDAPPEIRAALKPLRRWSTRGSTRRKSSIRVHHQELTRDGVTTDLSVGKAYFDRLDLETRREQRVRVSITVYGLLQFAPT